jgi:hypothetical protein
MMKATGWQQHSVRGFLASIVAKAEAETRLEEIDGAGVFRLDIGTASDARRV